MNTVYIVTSGCYSDYSIDAVFSTREAAEAYIGTKTNRDIEEWQVDTEEG